jgi:flavin reductase (DIM6/NTAB) family NADH-FMN oxidoreductase RutF
VNYQPPMLAVALGKQHHTPKGIVENGTFIACA